jgi:hypothetical protein
MVSIPSSRARARSRLSLLGLFLLFLLHLFAFSFTPRGKDWREGRENLRGERFHGKGEGIGGKARERVC